MTYCHRIATRADLPSIVDIYNSAIPSKTATCDLEPVTVASREAWFEESTPDRYPIWVAFESYVAFEPCVVLETESAQAVTGYLSFEPFLNGRRGYDVTADLAIYLHPEHQGKGLGAYLLREAINHAHTLGFRNLATTIFASNSRSIRLFLAHGFQEWGRLPGVADLDGIVQDVVFVGRQVGSGTGH